MNRDAILREMGIGPRWKLRVAPAAVSHVAAGIIDEEPVVPPIAPAAARTVRMTPATPPALDADDGQRERRIAQMDWSDLKAAVGACTACGLCKGRTNTVFGVGDESAGWMIVGEAPGAEEDAKGEPFVGQAGRLLDAMLTALDMRRGVDVYIANVLKCRPPGNRNPEAAEVARCAPHLLRQIALVRPALIVLMGRFAAQTLLETDASIASLRGRVHDYRGTPAIVTYHPAYLLRTLTDKAKSWEDLLFARTTYRRLQSATGATT